LEGLTGEYERRYGEIGEMASVDAQAFEPPDGVFLVLLERGVTVAGGGLRRLTADTCEVKRMWTAPDRRRIGHASTILDALEAEARNRGYTRLRLETGPAQPEARSLYERRGYRTIPPYGIYEQATAFELVLGSP
jgi:GNAT superfamily N-acetyltransferase